MPPRQRRSAAGLPTSLIPFVALYYSGLGYCAGKQGRKAEALALTRKAAELEPDNAVNLCNLGWALIDAGHPGEAAAPRAQSTSVQESRDEAPMRITFTHIPDAGVEGD